MVMKMNVCNEQTNQQTDFAEQWITKQAAIDWLTNEWDGMVTSAFDGIKNLPSAQPEKRTEERTETHACDLIDRQAAIEALNMLFKKQVTQFGYEGYEKADEKTQLVCDGISESIGCVMNLPSAQPVRKTGQWIKRKKGAIGYNCSCCGKSDISNHFDYCPNCGADMRGEQE